MEARYKAVIAVFGVIFFGGQPAFAQSIDQLIDGAIKPASDMISGLVFYAVTINGVDVPLVVIWLLVAALYFTFHLGFINFTGFKQAIKVVRGRYDNPKDPGEVTHFQALTAAVSGTVGLGNITGVAVAIAIGGPGATFWMILAGIFGMTLKYAECTLGLKYRHISKNGKVTGGPMHYLSDGLAARGLPTLGRILAILSAILCIGGAFGSAALFQVNQSGMLFRSVLIPITGGADSIWMSGWVYGVLFAAFAGLVIIGGVKKIGHVTSYLVPIMGGIYLFAALLIIAINIGEVPYAIELIVTGAFAPEGVAGGFIGVLILGMKRATFSNEAGLGSAAIVHAAAKTKEPVAEGLVALLEPFIDTVVMCTATALVIIVTGLYAETGAASDVLLTAAAFESAFSWFPAVLAVAVVLFAFSTAITWFYYGQRCFIYLFGFHRRADTVFKLVYLLAIVIGSSLTFQSVIALADALLWAMAVPNIIGLYILAPEVKRLTKDYFARLKDGKIPEFTLQS